MWLSWHFYEMPVFLFSVWKNYINFGLDYFSLPTLALTLLSPWRRYHWRYPKSFDIGGYFSAFISNIFSRLMGAIARVMLMVIGVIMFALIVIVGFIALVFWLLIPFIIISLITLQFYAI